MGNGFEDLIDDIKNRDDDDVIGIKRREKPKPDDKDVIETRKQKSERVKKEEPAVFGDFTKKSEEMIGNGIELVLGIGVLKGIGNLFKK